MKPDLETLRVAGWLLVVGGSLAIIGALLPPTRQWTRPLEEGLQAIDGNLLGFRAIHAGFASGTIVSALGLAALARALRDSPAGTLVVVVAVLFAFASVLWLVNIAYRLGVWTWAAHEYVASGAVPPAFAPWRAFAGYLFIGFSALGYLSVAGLGQVARIAQLGPGWLGVLLIVWGLSGGFVVGANVPLIMYVPFVALGGVLLRY